MRSVAMKGPSGMGEALPSPFGHEGTLKNVRVKNGWCCHVFSRFLSISYQLLIFFLLLLLILAFLFFARQLL